MLQDLCTSHHIVALQEHWLAPAGMNKLNIINNQFNVFGDSGMVESREGNFAWQTVWRSGIYVAEEFIKSD